MYCDTKMSFLKIFIPKFKKCRIKFFKKPETPIKTNLKNNGEIHYSYSSNVFYSSKAQN